MTTRLIQRILNEKPVLPNPDCCDVPIDYRVLSEKMRDTPNLLANLPVIEFDNVAAYYASSDKQVWQLSDMPNWAPPWNQFFVEWNEPEYWVIDGKIQYLPGKAQIGFVVLSLRLPPDTDATELNKLMGGLTGCLGIAGISKSQLQGIISKSRWILFCDRWASICSKPVFGRPIWTGMHHFIFVSPEGNYVEAIHAGPTLHASLAANKNCVDSPLHILGLGISFCHCKNVGESSVNISTPGRNLSKTEHPHPTVKVYTLKIGEIKKTLSTEGDSDNTGVPRALHICRGHFAHYTEENPLFGKYSGDFWKPDHTRGNAFQGKILKSYSVSPKST